MESKRKRRRLTATQAKVGEVLARHGDMPSGIELARKVTGNALLKASHGGAGRKQYESVMQAVAVLQTRKYVAAFPPEREGRHRPVALTARGKARFGAHIPKPSLWKRFRLWLARVVAP